MRDILAIAAHAIWICLVAGPALAGADRAAPDPSTLCQSAWRQASRESGVPEAVMHAISLTETGRPRDGGMQPWPWTVNMEGRGDWFDTAAAALAHVEAAQTRGVRSFDVGCFQINHRWHGEQFASLSAMFDPLTNARYAARFLTDLHAETGDWAAAAGAYHSRSPEYANRYRTRFEEILAGIAGDAAAVPSQTMTDGPATQSDLPRQNRFPLLRASVSGTGGLGSLVPLGDGAGPLLRGRARGGGDDAG